MTTFVERINPDIIKMTLTNSPDDQEVLQSFKSVNDMLSSAKQPMFVMTDIRANANIPITCTLTGALFGPYSNPNLREWLIIGSSSTARFIERTLTAETGRNLMRWFKDENEANNYIMRNTQPASTA